MQVDSCQVSTAPDTQGKTLKLLTQLLWTVFSVQISAAQAKMPEFSFKEMKQVCGRGVWLGFSLNRAIGQYSRPLLSQVTFLPPE